MLMQEHDLLDKIISSLIIIKGWVQEFLKSV